MYIEPLERFNAIYRKNSLRSRYQRYKSQQTPTLKLPWRIEKSLIPRFGDANCFIFPPQIW